MRLLPARARLLILAFAVCALHAATPILPLKDVRAGLKGTGRTVFAGSKIESFDVEILGVLENIGPKQSLILGRLSGGPLEKTGVMQGMSGSPVYIDGKLIGAVAMAFQFAKEPIAGIRPIEEMLASSTTSVRRPEVRASLTDKSLTERLPRIDSSPDRPIPIATPLSLTGFTQGTVEHFASALRAIGFEPRQGVSGGRAVKPAPAVTPEPGSMISVQLVNGDLSVGADGTVTHVDGNRIHAFGHRFLSVGETELPFTNASVMALLANVSTSFKISAAGSFLGTMTGDYNAAVSGELGRKARMAKIRIGVKGASGRTTDFRMEMVQDRILSPLLLQMMTYSAMDGSERTLGSSSVRLKGTVRFQGIAQPVSIDNIYSGDFNTPLVASLGTALPVAYALQNTTDLLRVESVDLNIEAMTDRRQFTIDQVWTSQREVLPGETIDIHVLLSGEAGREVVRHLKYEVPSGARAGTLNLTVADGPSTNAGEGKAYNLSQLRPASQVIDLLNSLRGQTRGWLRVWRSDPGYTLDGHDLPDPPPSVGLLLAKTPGASPNPGRGSTVAELSFDAGMEAVISGAKTITVEVKE